MAILNFKKAIHAQEDINVKWSDESWSVGEIVDHFLKVENVDFETTQKSDRAYNLHADSIKEFF